MDPDIVDSVTADSLERGDLIKIGSQFVTVLAVQDRTDEIHVVVDDVDMETLRFDPDAKVDIYLYPAEVID